MFITLAVWTLGEGRFA